MTREPRAFFALDLGAATTSAALLGRVSDRWRLLGSLSFPADSPLVAVLGRLVERFAAADPELAAALGAGPAAASWPRLTVHSVPPSGLAVVAVSERALGQLADVAALTGWRVLAGSAERLDPLAMTRLLLDPDISAVLVGAGEPPGADERGGLGDLAALAAATSVRRPELTMILAGAMADQAPRFESRPAQGPGAVILAPPASAGSPPGTALRALLEGLRGLGDDARRSFARAVATLAEALDRRIEAVDIGVDGGVRVVAAPRTGEEPPRTAAGVVADAALAPPDPDEEVVDGVLGWSTIQADRHRMRDRLRELRRLPWGDVAGEGAPFRLAAARAAVQRLVAATPELDAMPPPDLLVVAGGAWAVAPGPAIALAVADVLRRPGVTQVVFDHARLLAPLGTIDDNDERRVLLADLADDLLAPLGTVVIPQGLRGGKNGGRLVVHGATGSSELDLVPGGLELVDLPPGETAVAEFQFRDAVRLGTRGKHFAVDVAGGLGGLLVDLRDIPLRLPERAERRRELLAAWQEALWTGVSA
ncbi:MAG TPA: hypothetical protein VH723_03120 [Candidatus Limnocylindrales bacterium]